MPGLTIFSELIDEVTIVELEEGNRVKLGTTLDGENRVIVLETLKSPMSIFA